MTTTLLDLLRPDFGSRTAIVLPESGQRVTYDELRHQVQALADSLTAFGIKRGDRVGMALPNGLPTIVAFMAASLAGTAAPLNPAYRDEEFRFYLEDTSAKVLLLPSDGADAARSAAKAVGVPVVAIDVDAGGHVKLQGVSGQTPHAAVHTDDVAL